MRGTWYDLPLEARDAVYRRQFEETARLRRFIYGLIPLRRSGSIIEPGCGTGLIMREVAPLTGASLTGFDRDEEALGLARERVPGLKTVVCDLERCRFPGAGIILLSHVLLELADPEGFLSGLAGCLRPGGRLAVMGEYDWNAASATSEGCLDLLRGRMEHDGLNTRLAGRLRDALTGAGLRLLHSGAAISTRELDPLFLEGVLGHGTDPAGPDAWGAHPVEITLPVVWAVCGA